MITNNIISVQNLLAIDFYYFYLFTSHIILNINFRCALNSPSVKLLKSVEANATRTNLNRIQSKDWFCIYSYRLVIYIYLNATRRVQTIIYSRST